MGGDSVVKFEASVGSPPSNTPFMCACGVNVRLYTARTKARGNYGRQFFRCALYYEDKSRSCGLFKWADELVADNPKPEKIGHGSNSQRSGGQSASLCGPECIKWKHLCGVLAFFLILNTVCFTWALQSSRLS